MAETLFDAETDAWLPIPAWEPDPKQRYEVALFPFDGAPVVLAKTFENEDGEKVGVTQDAVWRATRAFDQKTGVWKFTGFWAKRNAGGARVDFEPDAYRRLVE